MSEFKTLSANNIPRFIRTTNTVMNRWQEYNAEEKKRPEKKEDLRRVASMKNPADSENMNSDGEKSLETRPQKRKVGHDDEASLQQQRKKLRVQQIAGVSEKEVEHTDDPAPVAGGEGVKSKEKELEEEKEDSERVSAGVVKRKRIQTKKGRTAKTLGAKLKQKGEGGKSVSGQDKSTDAPETTLRRPKSAVSVKPESSKEKSHSAKKKKSLQKSSGSTSAHMGDSDHIVKQSVRYYTAEMDAKVRMLFEAQRNTAGLSDSYALEQLLKLGWMAPAMANEIASAGTKIRGSLMQYDAKDPLARVMNSVIEKLAEERHSAQDAKFTHHTLQKVFAECDTQLQVSLNADRKKAVMLKPKSAEVKVEIEMEKKEEEEQKRLSKLCYVFGDFQLSFVHDPIQIKKKMLSIAPQIVPFPSARNNAAPLPPSSIKAFYQWDYFPHVRQQSMASGFEKNLETLQGHRGTYWVGALLVFDAVETAISGTKSVIENHF